MNYPELDLQSDKKAERLPPDVDLTAIYLREVGSTPLLDREKEVELASRILTARRDFAAAVLKLPATVRGYVLGGSGGKPKGKAPWSMKQIEACFDLLVGYSADAAELKPNKSYQAILSAKRRLDRSRDAMIEANLRLVAHVAKKFCNQGLPYMDLVQEGNLGLMKAVEKFEHERGYKFSTYAFWWIKQAITRAISDKSRTIRIPVHLVERMRKVQKAYKELEKELGRKPRNREIAEKTQLQVKAVAEVLGSGEDD